MLIHFNAENVHSFYLGLQLKKLLKVEINKEKWLEGKDSNLTLMVEQEEVALVEIEEEDKDKEEEDLEVVEEDSEFN